MAGKKPKQNKPKNKKLTSNQALWKKELKKLKRRAKYWEKHHNVLYTDFPSMPSIVRKKDIEALRKIQYKQFTDKQILALQEKYFDREYQKQQESYADYDPYWWEPEPVVTTEYVDTEQEMELWLEEKINSILHPIIIDREKQGAKQELETLLMSAKNRMGTKAFYEYLRDPSVASELEKCAHEYLESYINKGVDYGWPSLNRFATILNYGRTLTLSEQEELYNERNLNFDYSDVLD